MVGGAKRRLSLEGFGSDGVEGEGDDEGEGLSLRNASVIASLPPPLLLCFNTVITPLWFPHLVAMPFFPASLF